MNTPVRRSRLPHDLIAARHGVVLLAELRAYGMSRHAVAHALDRGDLERVAAGVFVVPGSPDTETRRALVATHALRGALSHRSATAWWGVPGFDLEPLDVVRLRRGSTARSPLGLLHQPRLLRSSHLTTWRDVRLTRPDRTLFDLAATVHPGMVERAYDTMWTRGLIRPSGMDKLLDELSVSGRTGVVLMRELIDTRRHLTQPTGSRLERRFEQLNVRAGIPRLRRQIDLGDNDEWIGRMDFVGDERCLVVEVDSELHHAAHLDVERDSEQTRRLEAAGWDVWRVDEDDLWNSSVWVVGELRRRWRAAPARTRV